jgi:methyl-accepting chemotaxis protein
MSAQVEEVSASTRSLEEMAQNLTLAVLQFRLSETQNINKLMDVFKIAHLQLVKNLRDMLDGKYKLQENQVTNHTECKFGQWYYGQGSEALKGLPEFIAVERPHKQLHEFARKAVRAFHQGDRRAAENYAREVENLSREIANALDTLKSKIASSAMQAATSEYTPTDIRAQSRTRADAVKVVA